MGRPRHSNRENILYNQDITQLLSDYQSGNERALNALFPAVYDELKQIAGRHLRKSWSVDTISATALVNEAYLKLIRQEEDSYANRAHFFAVAATAMRHIIINYAQQKKTGKRGQGWQQVTYEEAILANEHSPVLLLKINQALEEISTLDEKLARLVELRFFAGMTEVEIATVEGVSERTVRRNWKKAKALLMQALI